MILKTTLTVAILVLTPGFAMATGCSSQHEKQVMSCETGTTYDPATGACVTEPVSS